jgi:hypothetical protein
MVHEGLQAGIVRNSNCRDDVTGLVDDNKASNPEPRLAFLHRYSSLARSRFLMVAAELFKPSVYPIQT